MGLETRGLIRQTCSAFEIEIFKDVACNNHVHLLVSAPMKIDTHEIMRKVKERNSSKLFGKFPELNRHY